MKGPCCSDFGDEIHHACEPEWTLLEKDKNFGHGEWHNEWYFDSGMWQKDRDDGKWQKGRGDVEWQKGKGRRRVADRQVRRPRRVANMTTASGRHEGTTASGRREGTTASCRRAGTSAAASGREKGATASGR